MVYSTRLHVVYLLCNNSAVDNSQTCPVCLHVVSPVRGLYCGFCNVDFFGFIKCVCQKTFAHQSCAAVRAVLTDPSSRLHWEVYCIKKAILTYAFRLSTWLGYRIITHFTLIYDVGDGGNLNLKCYGTIMHKCMWGNVQSLYCGANWKDSRITWILHAAKKIKSLRKWMCITYLILTYVCKI